jgi:Core-2/I-Branching enzyme
VFVHLDAKSSETEYRNTMGQIADDCRFISRRFSIAWAGFSMIQATMCLLEEALTAGGYQNIALVSDDTFPIRPVDTLRSKLLTDHQRISARRLEPNEEFMHRYTRFFFLDHRATSLLGRQIESSFIDDAFIETMHRLEKRRKLGKEYIDVYYGSQWWSLTVDCASAILHRYQDDTNLRESFEFSAVPDEMYIQSMVMTLVPNLRRVEGPTLVDWNREPKPYVFTSIAELRDNIREDHCFVRKVSAKKGTLLPELCAFVGVN